MGTRYHPNQEIDDKAVLIVKDMLPGKDWASSKPDPDRLGIDLDVALRIDGAPRHPFRMQIKGKGAHTRHGIPTSLIGKDGRIRQQVELEHIEFYMNNSEPVFLVVVDTTQRTGYWLFVQRYVQEQLAEYDWRTRLRNYREGKGKRKSPPTVSVLVPASNSLTDVESFKQAVQSAREYMSSQAILSGIHYEQQELQRKDPRFDVMLNIVNGQKNFVLNAKESVSVDFSLPKEKGRDLLGRGVPVKLLPGELSAKGSPIWEELCAKGGVLHFQREFLGAVNLLRLDSDGVVVGRFDGIPCKYEIGELEIRFSTTLTNSVLRIEGTLSGSEPKRLQCTTSIDFDCWFKRPLLALPHFDAMFAFVGKELKGESLGIELMIPGQRIGVGTLRDDDGSFFPRLWEVVRPLSKARAIARRFSIDPATPSRFKRSELQEIEEAFELASGGEFRKTHPFASVTCQMSASQAKKLVRAINSTKIRGDFRGQIDSEWRIFGTPVLIKGITHHLTNMKVNRHHSTSRTSAKNVHFQFCSTRKTTHTVQGPKPKLLAAI